MKIKLVLYCHQLAEYAFKEIDYPPVFQEKMFIGFSDLMLRVEKIVWGEDIQEILACCGILLKTTEGLHEGTRMIFPFGKIPESLWWPKKFKGWTIGVADSQWDSILAPLLIVKSADEENQDFTGEE